MSGYETSSTEDSLNPAVRPSIEDSPDVLYSGLSKRPPFLETSNLGLFIDEGNANLLRDDFSICCEAYFHWRHNLEYSPNGEYPKHIREKLHQHIASPEFLLARTLFLSAIEQEKLPELVFLLWELYGYDPPRFTECLNTLRALQSAPSSVLSNIEIVYPKPTRRLQAYPETSPAGLSELKNCIDGKIKELEQGLNISSLDMGLQFLKTLSAEMTRLELNHHNFSKIDFPLCGNKWLERFWNEKAPKHWIVSPYEYGLNYFLYRELQVIDQSPRFMLRPPEIQRSSQLSASNDDEGKASAKGAYIRLLFGVAGCGKTKNIFDILSSNWGLYILPGGRSESLAGRTLQSDSVLLWSTISKVIDGLGNVCEEEEIRSSINRLVDALLACRLREFKRMYQTEYSSNNNKDSCTHWLQYQLTASGMNDNHFKRYFAIAQHLPQSRVDLYPGGYDILELNTFPHWLPKGRFYFCLDEFQSDFDRQAEVYSVPAGYKYSPASHGPMHMFNSTLEANLNHSIPEGLQWRIVLAGTSSYLGEVTRAIRPHRWIRAQSDLYYKVYSKFEPIKNFQDEFPEFLLAHTDQVFSEAWAIIRSTYESGTPISGHPNIHSESIGDADDTICSSDQDCLSESIRDADDTMCSSDQDCLSESIRDADDTLCSSDQDCLQSSALLATSGRHVPRKLRSALLDLFNKTQVPEAVGIETIFKWLREQIRAEQELITKIGLPLRGRHLWSSTYAQLILAIAIESYFQPSLDFRTKLQAEVAKIEVAKIERKTIKALRSNLKKLRETNRLIYSHICRLAIRADVLNRPTLFHDDYTGEMVTQGFAFAYSNPNNHHWKEGYVKMGEPLAIRAVLDHLNHDGNGRIEFERQINELVYINQDNASGLGFSTEYYLATSFDAVFRRGVELVSTDRRDKVKDHLQKNTSLIDDGANPQWTSSCQGLQISDFEFTQPANDDSELGKNSSFLEWLEQPPDAPKFCFPSTKAGPDLAFILNRSSGQDCSAPQINKILVTVQSKTAEQDTTAGYDVVKTMHTIDPNLWYISSPTCLPATKDIVQRWGTDPSCLILSILVVTSDYVVEGASQTCRACREESYRRWRCEQQHPTKPSVSIGKGGEVVQNSDMADPSVSNDKEGKGVKSPDKAQKLLGNLPNVNYAFCFMDRKMTQDLFGDAFTKLIDMAKKTPMKRAAPGDDNLPEKKRIKGSQQGPRRCTACNAEGHRKDNSNCPEYQRTQARRNE